MSAARGADEATIREQAYYYWEQDGRPHGRETEYWMRAVVAVSEKSQMDSLTKPAPKKAPKAAAATKLKAAASPAKAAPAKSAKAGGDKKPKKK